MKKLLFAIVFVGLISACTSKSYTITGKFEEDANGTAYLKKVEMQSLADIDTAQVVDGQFKFEGTVEHPELYLVYFENNQVPVTIFLENSNITISGQTDDLDNAVVKGSKTNDIFIKFNDEIPHKEKMESIRNEFAIAQSTGDQQAMQSLLADYQVIVEEQQEYFKSFLKSNKTNVVGAFLALNMIQGLEFDDVNEIVTSLENSLKNHPYIEHLKLIIEPMKAQAELEAKISIGKVAPNFTLKDINGNEFSLESLRGKYVFLDFWAGWCQPCRIENPNLVKVYEQFGGENFEIVSVSLDRSDEDWREAVKEDGLTWTLVHDAMGEIADNYAIQSIPTTFLLDKDGVIIEKQLRGEAIAEKIGSLLSE